MMRHKGFVAVPAKFLLTCSAQDLADMELMRLSEVQNLRSELMEIVDRMVEIATQASVIRWFRDNDRDSIKSELLREDAVDVQSIMDEANRMIRGGRDILPPVRKYADPGQGHRIASVTYSKRNIAKGKCMSCPQPLDPNSVRYCTEHLSKARTRAQQKKGLNSDPGSRNYLYAAEVQETHGRQPGTLASLAMNREQKTRAVTAELGIPPESAAVSLNAAVGALLKCMPHSEADALTQEQLFAKAMIPTRTTGQKALKKLLVAGEIARIGKGGYGHEYRYFAVG